MHLSKGSFTLYAFWTTVYFTARSLYEIDLYNSVMIALLVWFGKLSMRTSTKVQLLSVQGRKNARSGNSTSKQSPLESMAPTFSDLQTLNDYLRYISWVDLICLPDEYFQPVEEISEQQAREISSELKSTRAQIEKHRSETTEMLAPIQAALMLEGDVTLDERAVWEEVITSMDAREKKMVEDLEMVERKFAARGFNVETGELLLLTDID